MNKNLVKITTVAALTTAIGIGIAENNVLADTQPGDTATSVDSGNINNNQPTISNVVQQQASATTTALYSANLNTQEAQYVNFPQGYTLDKLRGISNSTEANNFQQTIISGMSMNNYQSNSAAAKEYVNVNNISPEQTIQMNQYGVGLVNQIRSEFGLEPFQLNDETIDQVRSMAFEYQNKNESLMNGHWHDPEILNNHSENIAAQQIYNDNINGLTVRPFATAKGDEFINNNAVPVFSITTMDDLRALIYYGVLGMLFNDASDIFGHAQNFLTNPQSINTLGIYPSITKSVGTGTYSDGSKFNFNLLNIDMHFIWAEGDNNSSTAEEYNTPGWHLIDNEWRHFDQAGLLELGWKWINGNWYYLEPTTGNMQTGLKNVNGNVYYLNNSGAMVTGWQRLNGNWYYFQNNGAALTGWQFINGHWYYFTGQGVAETNWQWIGNHKYYFDLDNAWALTSWQILSGNWYYFDVNNAWMDTNWQWIDNNWFYFNPSYGQMMTGLQTVGNSLYFLNTQHDGSYGAMRTGWWNINNNWYFFYNNGAAAKGWFRSGAGNWYYFGNDGKALTGWQKINGHSYYFDTVNAWAVRGFQLIDNSWYYFDPINTWQNSGWQFIGNNWFYMNSTTGQMESGLQTVNGKVYFLTTQHNGLFGAMTTGWQKVNGKWYYFDASGSALIGWQKINGHYYHFKNNGEADTGDVYLTNNGQSKLYHFDEQNAWLTE